MRGDRWGRLAACVGVLALAETGRGAATDGGLEAEARRILEVYCHRCHGEDGRNEGGFNVVADLEKLVRSKRVVPGRPDESKIYRMIADGRMPPDIDLADEAEEPPPLPRPTEEEVARLRGWIEDGATTGEPPEAPWAFITDLDVIMAVRDDLNRLPDRERRHARYFTITHLANAGYNAEQLQTYRVGLSKLVNGLSWGRAIAVPEPIDPAGTVLRIDLRDYLWTDATWEAILAPYPYGVRHRGAAAEAVRQWTRCEVPMVRADWFVFAASRPPLYHEVLRLPEDERDLAWKLNVDLEADIRQDRVARAGFGESGISRNNRLIERHESSFGSYWRSYDFAGNADRRNLFAHPLGPSGVVPEDEEPHAFLPDGGEVIFSLPNGLFGFLLVDESGMRIDRGPTTIVRDPKQADGAVVTGISCMSCHGRGLIPKADQIRPLARRTRAFPESVVEAVEALHPEAGTWDALIREDNERFLAAVAATGAASGPTEPVFALARQFEQDLDVGLAAAESGLRRPEFELMLEDVPQLAVSLGPLLVGGNVKRDAFVAVFPVIASHCRLDFVPPTGFASGPLDDAPAPGPDATAGHAGRPMVPPAHPVEPKTAAGPGRAFVDLPQTLWNDRHGYRDFVPEGGTLVGFQVTFSEWFNTSTIGSIRPIYQTPRGRVMGPQRGTTSSPKFPPQTILARPGYAVGGFHTRTGLTVDNFQVVFMRVKGDRLDPSDNYISPWISTSQGGGPGFVTTDGRMVIGIQGMAERQLLRLGLMVEP